MSKNGKYLVNINDKCLTTYGDKDYNLQTCNPNSQSQHFDIYVSDSTGYHLDFLVKTTEDAHDKISKLLSWTLKERISIKTRQYAKRQSTWARGQMSDWQKINPKDLSKLLKKI